MDGHYLVDPQSRFRFTTWPNSRSKIDTFEIIVYYKHLFYAIENAGVLFIASNILLIQLVIRS